MITKVSGDILLTDAQVIAHGVAPDDHFNHGLALQLREHFPAMVKDFRSWCHQTHPKSGHAWLWASPEHVIINLMTQEKAHDHNANPGPASHHNVDHALKELAKLAQKENLKSIALPRLATGVGSMDWAEVEPLIEKHLGNLDISVIIYETYVQGQKAAENLNQAA
ncbi:MAG TPA: macro domain-containing protein [Alphaproteobacteria bacterium]|nr:macro domain-containing protein [Alphaproteobacteria bacterium]HNS44203.1 macro domain-containing protein [Alphaproteobacteria bacterium]